MSRRTVGLVVASGVLDASANLLFAAASQRGLVSVAAVLGSLYPVATVILGGLITSTFCEFLIHPGLFWRFSGKDAERLVREGGAERRGCRGRECGVHSSRRGGVPSPPRKGTRCVASHHHGVWS